jgi:hypothetical protein
MREHLCPSNPPDRHKTPINKDVFPSHNAKFVRPYALYPKSGRVQGRSINSLHLPGNP